MKTTLNTLNSNEQVVKPISLVDDSTTVMGRTYSLNLTSIKIALTTVASLTFIGISAYFMNNKSPVLENKVTSLPIKETANAPAGNVPTEICKIDHFKPEICTFAEVEFPKFDLHKFSEKSFPQLPLNKSVEEFCPLTPPAESQPEEPTGPFVLPQEPEEHPTPQMADEPTQESTEQSLNEPEEQPSSQLPTEEQSLPEQPSNEPEAQPSLKLPSEEPKKVIAEEFLSRDEKINSIEEKSPSSEFPLKEVSQSVSVSSVLGYVRDLSFFASTSVVNRYLFGSTICFVDSLINPARSLDNRRMLFEYFKNNQGNLFKAVAVHSATLFTTSESILVQKYGFAVEALLKATSFQKKMLYSFVLGSALKNTLEPPLTS